MTRYDYCKNCNDYKIGGVSATIKRERFLKQDEQKEKVICTKDITINCTKEFIKANECVLTERQIDILLAMAEDNSISSPKIALKISLKKPVSERTIKSDLSILQKKGYIRHEGGRKLRALVINFYGKIEEDFSTD
ncbi:MAG: hypothetical protein IKO46_08825 [Salinivirgaceae bacterium]|nr:hypothetical protein [Salinivirgaceae bacterium]MBR6083907.1 hypothetical protein [Salinivirgaceae bacterium]